MLSYILLTLLIAIVNAAIASPSAFVVQVSQQTRGQPYPRGVSNQELVVQIGHGKNIATYRQASGVCMLRSSLCMRACTVLSLQRPPIRL